MQSTFHLCEPSKYWHIEKHLLYNWIPLFTFAAHSKPWTIYHLGIVPFSIFILTARDDLNKTHSSYKLHELPLESNSLPNRWSHPNAWITQKHTPEVWGKEEQHILKKKHPKRKSNKFILVVIVLTDTVSTE